MTVEDWIRALVSSPVIAAFIVGIFSIFTVGLPLRRFRRQKWWERQADTYSSILEALHLVIEEHEKHYDAYIEHREVPEDQKAELRRSAQLGQSEITKRTRIGSFIISKNAEDILTALRKEVQAAWNEAHRTGDYFDGIDAEGAALNKALRELRSEAARHLGVSRH